jgi:hypothetical protein
MPALFVYLLVLLAGAAAHAQPCTDGPYTSATSLATIDAAVDAAADGDVVCLRRGNQWTDSSGAAFTLTTGHPAASRVTICSSDDTQCTRSSGGANARITVSGAAGFRAISFSATGDGYFIQDIDFYGDSGCDNENDSVLGGMPAGVQDITFQGGVWDGWDEIMVSSGNTANLDPLNIRIGNGLGSNRVEFRNCQQSGLDGHNKIPIYGLYDDLYVAMWIHHWGQLNNTGGTGHIVSLHFPAGAYGEPYGTWEANRPVLEHNLWQFHSGYAGGGTVARFSRGTDLTMRYNVFETVGPIASFPNTSDPAHGCGVGGPGFHTHGGDDNANNTYWHRAEIYRNRFRMGDCNAVGIENQNGTDVEVYANVFDLTDQTSAADYWGRTVFTGTPSGPQANHDNFWVYNNTFYFPANQSEIANIDFQGGTGQRFYNNAIWTADANAVPMTISDCSIFGSNGIDLHDNFVYSVNDSTPTLPSCSASLPDTSADGFGPGAPWSTLPGFANAGAGDFDIDDAAALSDVGSAVGIPASDFEQAPWTATPAIGAFSEAEPSPPGCGVGPELSIGVAGLMLMRRRRARFRRRASA